MKFNELDWVIIVDRHYGHQFDIGEKVMIVELTEYGYWASNGNGHFEVRENEIKPFEA